jgi:hypothetical protein
VISFLIALAHFSFRRKKEMELNPAQQLLAQRHH